VCAVCSHGEHKYHNLSTLEEEAAAIRERIQVALNTVIASGEGPGQLEALNFSLYRNLTGHSINTSANLPVSFTESDGQVGEKLKSIRLYFNDLRLLLSDKESELVEEVQTWGVDRAKEYFDSHDVCKKLVKTH
jgi:hypothetical protein